MMELYGGPGWREKHGRQEPVRVIEFFVQV